MYRGQTLVFDADDTLWENNVLFERVIDGFLAWAAPSAERARARAVLDAIEAENAPKMGYGAVMFRHSLAACLEEFTGHAVTETETAKIEELLEPLTIRRVELIDGVADTLGTLAERHELLLLTKGEEKEQRWKLDASGIAHHFGSVHIVPEKDVETYLRLTESLGLEPGRTWMIGNSPKSDILPAGRAGLRTVFIPHDHTWVLEGAELGPESATLTLKGFTELVEHF